MAVANPINVSNSNTKFGKISFNGEGEDSITGSDDARKYLEIFFCSKGLTCLPFASECVCWFNLGVLFIYSKENCIIWHFLASILALLEFVSSSVPMLLEYRLFQTSTRTDLPTIG